MKTYALVFLAAVLATGTAGAQERTVPLTDLVPIEARQSWGSLGIDRSVQGKRLQIGKREFDRGLGTHAASEIVYDLDGAYRRFEAWVGVDAEMDAFGKSSVVFKVLVDGKEAFDSGVMLNDTPAKQVSVSVAGASELRLVVTDAGNDINGDHGDWADAVLIGPAEAAQPPARAAYAVRAPGVTVKLSTEGALAGVELAGGKVQRAVTGGTRLSGCRPRGPAHAKKLTGGGVEFTRDLLFHDGLHACRLVERFTPTPSSVRWQIELRSAGKPWTTAITTRLNYPDAPSRAFWAAWSDPDHRSDGWRDPLVFRPFTSTAWSYANMSNSCPLVGDFITMPLATAVEPDADAGLSLILSPEDTLLDLSLVTSASGTIAFTRTRYRLGGGKTVRFAMDLVGHAADWRAPLGWIAARYPRYFNPANPAADDLAGCGAYSGNEDPVDAAKLKRMAFRTNWKLSDDFPYMGMFLPPLQGPDDRWERACDEPAPPGKPRWSSFRRLNDYARYMRSQGFYVLDYFNVTEYGRNLKDAPVDVKRCAADPELWKKPMEFLKTRLPNAYLRPPIGTCYGAWVVDVGDPGYQKFMLEQAKRHIEKLPDTSGICIDRMDWLRTYNPRGDDGVSWVDGKPARSLYQSWLAFTAKLAPMMHQAGKVIFVNNHQKRLELLRDLDGVYCEFCQAGPALNATGLLCVRRPAIGWTDGEGTVRADPDAFFQRHLHLGVFPTAPYPNNNHCIQPSPWVDEQYLAYGPLLDVMRGRKWVLAPHAVSVAGGEAKANLFRVPGGYALPVTFAGKAERVSVTLRGLPDLAGATCEALHPGSDKWAPLPTVAGNGCVTLDVPVQRGCAMVRIQVAKAAAGR